MKARGRFALDIAVLVRVAMVFVIRSVLALVVTNVLAVDPIFVFRVRTLLVAPPVLYLVELFSSWTLPVA